MLHVLCGRRFLGVWRVGCALMWSSDSVFLPYKDGVAEVGIMRHLVATRVSVISVNVSVNAARTRTGDWIRGEVQEQAHRIHIALNIFTCRFLKEPTNIPNMEIEVLFTKVISISCISLYMFLNSVYESAFLSHLLPHLRSCRSLQLP